MFRRSRLRRCFVAIARLVSISDANTRRWINGTVRGTVSSRVKEKTISAVTDTAESAASTTDWTSPIEMRPRTFLPKLKAIIVTTPTTNANVVYATASTMWSNAYNFGSRNASATGAAINTMKISPRSM